MKNQFAYPAKVVQDGKFFVITFRDVPQAITQADSKEEIISAAIDVLKDVVSFYMDDGDAFPLASNRRKGEVLIELPLSFAAKIVLYNTMKKNKVKQADLARALNLPTSEIARIVNPWKKIKIDTLVKAIKAAGGQVALSCA